MLNKAKTKEFSAKKNLVDSVIVVADISFVMLQEVSLVPSYSAVSGRRLLLYSNHQPIYFPQGSVSNQLPFGIWISNGGAEFSTTVRLS